MEKISYQDWKRQKQKFRRILPRMAKLIDSQLQRRALSGEHCAFEYAHNGRMSNSLGQTCVFQARFRLTDHPESCALFEVVESLHSDGSGRDLKEALRYERESAS